MYRADVLELDDSEVDASQLARLIDSLQAKLCRVVAAAAQRGEHLNRGQSPVSWVAQTCKMSKTSAADRLCVGAELESLPQVEAAVKSGRIGYQAASVICHLSRQLGEKRDRIEEEVWVGYASRFSIKGLRYLALAARHAWDPEGFDRDGEEDYENRYLFISEMRGMYRLDGLLDAEGGAALKSAIDGLAKPLGQDDRRAPKQRRADALVELAYHAMDGGTLPRRNGVRPHISVATTLEGLKAELGAAASELEHGSLVSSKTVQRLGLRRDSDPRPEGGLGGERRRPGDPGRLAFDQASAPGSRQRLPLPRLRPAGLLDERPSHRLRPPRRADQPAQSRAGLPSPPPPRPRGRLAGDSSRGRDHVPAAGPAWSGGVSPKGGS